MTEEQKKYELVSVQNSMWFDVAKFEHGQRVVKMLSAATILPDLFRGNVGNCMILLNYAERLNVDPMMLAQKMYIVHGKHGVEAQLKIGLFNSCGRFTPIRWDHENPNTDNWVCTAYTTEKETDTRLDFPIDWATVKRERWLEKSGSKWKTMPYKMMQYRSASWLIDLIAPEVVMGLATTDEIAEAIDVTPQQNGSYAAVTATEKLKELESMPEVVDAEPEPSPEDESVVPPEEGEVEAPAEKHGYECKEPGCTFIGKTPRGLKQHMALMHKPKEEPKEEPPAEPEPAEQKKEYPTYGEEPDGPFDYIAKEQQTGVYWQKIKMLVESSSFNKDIWKNDVMPKLAKAPITADDDPTRIANLYSMFSGLLDGEE